jgi:hypothetical protein
MMLLYMEYEGWFKTGAYGTVAPVSNDPVRVAVLSG